MEITIIIIIILYLFLIGVFVIGFDKVKEYKLRDLTPKTTFTVVIPFRNEAENIPKLITSLLNLNYPKDLFEILLVNDDSEDQSVDIIKKQLSKHKVNSVLVKIIDNQRLTQSPKKDAITTAITQAKHEWIITTDADCTVPIYWLDSFDNYIQDRSLKMLAGPVTYNSTNRLFYAFQTLDFLSLIGATIGGFGIRKPFLCNGANLAYKKDFFTNLNGFEGNNNIASGDDIFLMEMALKEDKNAVHFLKSEQAIVNTAPQKNFKDLLSQRVRWASKTSNYNNTFAKIVGLLVLMANATIVISIVLTALDVFKFKTFAYLFFIKIAIDYLLLYKTSQFFNKQETLKHYVWSCFLYPFFSVFVAFISLFTNYKWKGRSFKK